MKTKHLLSISCAVAALAGCGPGTSDSTTTMTTDPVPQTCFYDGVMYQDGDEFQTADGCVRYRCESGALTAIADNRITIAGDLDLPTQPDVDGQECLGVVEGSLTISGTAADLTPLRQLYRIGGDLTIVETAATSLAGLEGLSEVGESITIADNTELASLNFQFNMSAFGDVTIQNNDKLTTLNGAEFLGQCSTCASLGDEPQHASGDGDQATGGGFEPSGDSGEGPGGTFYGNIVIADNDTLVSVSALSNLWVAWADVRLRNNAALATIGYMGLYEVRGDLEISRHPLLPFSEVDNLALGVDVLGETIVCGNQGGAACPE